MEQAEFMSSVRRGFTAAQAVATARLESLNGDARRVFDDLVERGKTSQRDITERLQRIARAEAVQEKMRPVEEAFRKVQVAEYRARLESLTRELTRRLSELQQSARGLVETASREQLHTAALELRRVADLLETLSRRLAAEVPTEAVPVETQAISVEDVPASTH